jgi:hypothetical protein
MHSRILFAICCLGFAIPSIAQLNSSALRSKYGPPLNRETFHMPEGFDLLVDYDAANQVCRLEVPALMPTGEAVSNSDEMKKRMYDFLADLVPAAMRGKELAKSMFMSGAMISNSSVQYEHVTINELQYTNQPFGSNNTITVTFKNCETPPLR